jgi:hypothetical protein
MVQLRQLSSQVVSLQVPGPYSEVSTIQSLFNHQTGQSINLHKGHSKSWLLSAARLAMIFKAPYKYLQIHRFLVRVYSLLLNTALYVCSLAVWVEPSGSSNEHTQMNLYWDWEKRTLAPVCLTQQEAEMHSSRYHVFIDHVQLRRDNANNIVYGERWGSSQYDINVSLSLYWNTTPLGIIVQWNCSSLRY